MSRARKDNRQWQFIRNTLSSVPDNMWKIVVIHRDQIRIRKNKQGKYYYSYCKFAPFFLPLFDEFKIDIVFQGHAHHYSHFEWSYAKDPQAPQIDPKYTPQNHRITFITTGGSGNLLRRNAPIMNQMDTLNDIFWHENSSQFLHVEILDQKCVIHSIYPDGTTMHKREIKKEV